MFVGVPGAGAEEGWYLTQLEFELRRRIGSQITAGSIDIFKCFDQTIRPLVYAVARKAGIPEDIIKTYETFVEQMGIVMQIGPALGVEHHHSCSIPQGCPFSMAFIALLLKPWINMMRAKGVEPRALADDLFFFSPGTRHA